MQSVFLLAFCSFVLVVNGQFLNSTRKRLNEESRPGVWHTIELPLDHFNVLDNRTYTARYITNDQFYKKGGPIIVYIGGEWEIEDYGVRGGVAFQLARQHNGYLFYPEHRYFGKSLPFPQPVSTENLRYITPDFSLADLAFSISHIKNTVKGLKNSQVAVVGGSYAGALAVWGRLKYPHIIDIAYACGGVTSTNIVNTDYYDVNFKSLKKINPKCADILKSGLEEASKLMSTEKGEKLLHEMFRIITCPYQSYFNIQQLIHQCFNPQVWPVYKSAQLCHHLVTNTSGSPIQRLAQTVAVVHTKKESVCVPIDREWFFLVCTFMGNLQVTTKNNYGNMFTLKHKLQKSCTENFGPKFNERFVTQRTRSTTLLYGGITPDVTKVLSMQGTHDPWYPTAILDELNDETPVVYIEDANHCLEIGEEQDDETPQVAQSKIVILELLAKWLK